MSWASRRRTLYVSGIALFLLLVFGIPVALWLYDPPSCADGVQNQGETSPDHGGPCPLLDGGALIPYSIQWTRAFAVRNTGEAAEGMHNAVAYLENPNEVAGVAAAPYRIRLYDSGNVLVAERTGTTFIMPGSITPVFEGAIVTGNRSVARAFFEFTAPLVWEKLVDTARVITVNGKQASDTATMPRITAVAENTSVTDAKDVKFVAVVFNPASNAFAASQTIIPFIGAGERANLVFSWPEPFTEPVGRIDIIPVHAPARPR